MTLCLTPLSLALAIASAFSFSSLEQDLLGLERAGCQDNPKCPDKLGNAEAICCASPGEDSQLLCKSAWIATPSNNGCPDGSSRAMADGKDASSQMAGHFPTYRWKQRDCLPAGISMGTAFPGDDTPKYWTLTTPICIDGVPHGLTNDHNMLPSYAEKEASAGTVHQPSKHIQDKMANDPDCEPQGDYPFTATQCRNPAKDVGSFPPEGRTVENSMSGEDFPWDWSVFGLDLTAQQEIMKEGPMVLTSGDKKFPIGGVVGPDDVEAALGATWWFSGRYFGWCGIKGPHQPHPWVEMAVSLVGTPEAGSDEFLALDGKIDDNAMFPSDCTDFTNAQATPGNSGTGVWIWGKDIGKDDKFYGWAQFSKGAQLMTRMDLTLDEVKQKFEAEEVTLCQKS